MFKIKNILSIISVVIISFSITTQAFSQNNLSEERHKILEQSLYYGLSSDVNGVVESALFNMLNYKIVYPGFNSDKVMDKAEKIAEETTSEHISSKATLVIFFYRNQDKFPESESLMAELDHMNQERIFEYLRNGDLADQFTSTQK